MRNKTLTQLLVISVTLNVGFLLAFILKELNSPQVAASKPLSLQIPISFQESSQILKDYFSFSFYGLVDELRETDPVEHGFKKQDFALACLVDFYYFDVERALPGMQVQRRKMLFVHPEGRERVELSLFPGLTPGDFEAIIRFIKSEKWPLTPEGLFTELMGDGPKEDALYDAFARADPFRLLFNLFERSGYAITQKELIQILCQGEWSFVERFYRSQMRLLDLSPIVFEGIVNHYLSIGSSKMAAKIIEWKRDDIIKRMDDAELVRFINLLKESVESVKEFLKKMLISVRSDEVRKAAGIKLYALFDKQVPHPFDYLAALRAFTPERVSSEVEAIKASRPISQMKRHIVKPGDSLWLIAKKYQVDMDEIVKLNDLPSRHHLDVGTELLIP
jgi:hypothetical protein